MSKTDVENGEAKVIAGKIYGIRLAMKAEKKEVETLISALKESLGDETELPGVCEFKTYDNVKTDWRTVAKDLSAFVEKDVYDRMVANNSQPTQSVKLLFEKDYEA